jgi:two-component system, NarL family, nitrate/nitrite response regulator NarL
MSDKIRVIILDDHQSVVDGYLFRLGNLPQIEIVATLTFGWELESALANSIIDVLLLDVGVPVSANNPNPYPILHIIPSLLQRYPNLAILVISMYSDRIMIRAVMEAGASGYVLKDDRTAIQELPNIIPSIANGGIYLSEKARKAILSSNSPADKLILTDRQLQALSLCLAYPDATTAELAQKMQISNSTLRNLLSGAYLRLEVHTRAAAIAKARQLGLITPDALSVQK